MLLWLWFWFAFVFVSVFASNWCSNVANLGWSCMWLGDLIWSIAQLSRPPCENNYHYPQRISAKWFWCDALLGTPPQLALDSWILSWVDKHTHQTISSKLRRIQVHIGCWNKLCLGIGIAKCCGIYVIEVIDWSRLTFIILSRSKVIRFEVFAHTQLIRGPRNVKLASLDNFACDTLNDISKTIINPSPVLCVITRVGLNIEFQNLISITSHHITLYDCTWLRIVILQE